MLLGTKNNCLRVFINFIYDFPNALRASDLNSYGYQEEKEVVHAHTPSNTT